MKLENQLTSLELSKRLKELGVKQESLHFWQYVHAHKDYEIDNGDEDPSFTYSAFTVAELGEMLPNMIRIGNQTTGPKYYLKQEREMETSEWYLFYQREGGDFTASTGTQDTEADARGLMLCYLIENGLITLK